MYVQAPLVCLVPTEPEEGIRFHGTGVEDQEAPHGCWEPRPGPVLLTAETSPRPMMKWLF